MESHFEINVSKDGVHFFATAPRSLPVYSTKKLDDVLNVIREKFPESEGYKISVTRWEIYGHVIEGNW